MAPTFKISFPLPGWRPNSSPHTTPGSFSSCRSENDGSPLAYPGSKAERILGGAELCGKDQRKKPSRKERKFLRKYPSFMSVTLVDEENELSRPEGGFPFPGMMTPDEAEHRNAQMLRRQGSSPLLGDNHIASSTSTKCLSITNGSQARRPDSSNTFRSHYDKSKASILISQQTSSSSSRDLALRKGLPLISVPPRGQSVSEASTLTHVSSTRRKLSVESKISEGSKMSASAKIARTPRRRPSVTDPPTLYPEAPRAFHAVSPPPALINSSLPSPMRPSSVHSKSFSRPRWWYRSKSVRVTSPPSITLDSRSHSEGPDQGSSPVNLNIREPKARARGWYEGSDEDDAQAEAQERIHGNELESKYHLIRKPAQADSISEILAQGSGGQPMKQRKSSFSSKSGPSDRKLSFRLDTPPRLREPIGSSSIPTAQGTSTTPNSPGSKSKRSAESSKGFSAGVDLQTQSVLSLSSSEDEDERITIPSRGSSSRRHRIRASVERADYGDDIQVGSAQRIQQVKPRPVVNKQNRQRPSSRRSGSPDIVPPVPQIPSRPHLGERNSSLRWRDAIEERSISTTDVGGDSTVENSSTNTNTPMTTPISARTSTTSPYKTNSSLRGSKLMKVTSEEEKLLEAMREKRASIRANEFQKGFNKALALQVGNDVFAQRPQTSGADGRSSSTQRSSYISNISTSRKSSTRGSVSPPLPLLTSARYNGFHNHTPKASLASLGTNTRRSLSTDNLLFQDQEEEALDNEAFPFPSVPEIVAGDVRPSTPSTGNLPLTPPPSISSHSMAMSGLLATSPGRMFMKVSGGNGHERKRTASSGVVMLDGVEAVAKESDEERATVGWGLDSY